MKMFHRSFFLLFHLGKFQFKPCTFINHKLYSELSKVNILNLEIKKIQIKTQNKTKQNGVTLTDFLSVVRQIFSVWFQPSLTFQLL
jgi:hypothetical protein